MPVDYSKIPTSDLEALAKGNMGKVSTSTLEMLSSGSEQPTTQTKPKQSWSDIGKNILPSAGKTIVGMVEPFVHPINTINNVADILRGAAENAIFPSIDRMTGKTLPPNEAQQKASAFGAAMAERYGGLENLKNTVITDPVGSVLDVSSIASLGATTMAKVPGLARYATIPGKVAEFTNPISLAFKPIAAAMNKVSETNLPESIYARTMKIPPGRLRDTERANVLKTLVRDEKLPLNGKTVDKMNKVIGDLDTQITSAIDTASQNGATASVPTILSNLDSLKKTYRNRPDPDRYYKAIDSVKSDIIEHDFNNRVSQTTAVQTPSVILGPNGQPLTTTKNITTQVPTGEIPLNKAHSLKKGIYQEIQDYYMKQQRPETGRVGIKNDVDAAAKATVAKVLRQEVMSNAEIPNNIKKMMTREAGLMNARKWVERATNRGGNLDPVSLSGMMFGVMVEKGMPAVAAWKIATSQPVMSRLAIALGKTRGALNPLLSNVAYQVDKANVKQEEK